MTTSIGKRLDALRGIGPGFDHLRIGLALAILTWHSFSISYGQSYGSDFPPISPTMFNAALLPMFFGLSGFLVMGSAIRTGEVKTFVTFRVLRILPALFTEIMISALVLGPLLTALPLRAYFSSPMFWEYFGSLIGRVRFSLPGLFLDNPAPQLVNFALWTVGPEILCYVILTLLMLTGAYRNRRLMALLVGAYTAFVFAVGLLFPGEGVGGVFPAKLLILCFLTGNIVFLFRDRLPFNLPAAIVGFAVSVGLMAAARETGSEAFVYLSVPGFVYFTTVIGLTRLPPLPFFHRGDYSYGIYIYGFPIQQAIAHFLPQHRDWWVNLGLALPLTLLFAVASWHFIEKPVLGLRKRILAKPQTDPVLPRTRFGARKAALLVLLAIYGLFVVDASQVLPTRSGAKMILYGFGLYDYKPNDQRPGQAGGISPDNLVGRQQ